MKITKLTKVLSFLFIAVSLWGAKIDMDYATFLGDENFGVVEVYINVPRSLFEFVENEGIWESNIFFRVALIQGDSIVAIDEWSIKDKKFSKDADTKSQKIPEISTLQAKPGKYELALYTFDLNTKKKYSDKKEIIIPDYTENKLMLSDIQLGLQMGKTEDKNKFSKYFGYDILPNASSIFTEGHLKIFPFCEVYNLEYNPKEKNIYQIMYSVIGLNGKEVKVLKESIKKKPGKSAVEVEYKGLDISDIGSGAYVLKVEVSDIKSKTVVVKGKKFYVIRQKEDGLLTSEQNFQEDISKLNKKELAEKFGPLSYIATNLEKKQFKKSDVAGKRSIINNFWKTRDTDYSTEMNEAEILFHRMVDKADKLFNSGFRKGWRCDRGRILIKYGEPDEIERFPNAIDSKPYEVWQYYNLEGGVQFVFLDRSGFGDMELVHSTARYELQDHDWQRMLK